MKKAIIIGATSGIGRGIAALLVGKGYDVGITGRRSNLLMEIKAENPDRYFVKPFDIIDTSSVPNRLEELVSELGGLDLLVVCSGIGDPNPDLNFLLEKQVIETNVLGFTAVADWAFNHFEKSGAGHIVAITSIAGLRGNRVGLSYSATKSYQIKYLEGLRQRVSRAKQSIFITDIRPGFVGTAMAKSDKLFWVASVDKAAGQIYRAIRKRRKVAYITRRWFAVAMVYKALPSWIYDRM